MPVVVVVEVSGIADVKIGVSTKRMLDQHYTPMAHGLQFPWSLFCRHHYR
jgi:hypothetical protein